MGGIASRRNAGVEEVDISTNNAYRYPPRSGEPSFLRHQKIYVENLVAIILNSNGHTLSLLSIDMSTLTVR